MTTFLTISLYAYITINAILAILTILLTILPPKPTQPKTVNHTLRDLILITITIPIYYLNYLGFTHLHIPLWIYWLIIANHILSLLLHDLRQRLYPTTKTTVTYSGFAGIILIATIAHIGLQTLK
ncbi:hypothetical protein [Deinococcus misasensis]|uniref:hypothetical protein n=1 Tax=Deinococcus misasensis TaxID=392413 RepID=UPI0005583041|nr:hypothetical protein [Deinococcus misasensis]